MQVESCAVASVRRDRYGAADTLAGMVTANVIQRVLNIRIDDSQGSAFTIEREGRQYVVTARHVVEGIEAAQRTAVVFDDEWRDIDFSVVGVAEGDVDVAVLACGQQLSPTYPFEASTEGLVYGQRAYFLGFPFGWTSGGQHLNRGFPFPFVKGGIVAAYSLGGPVFTIFLDAHVNHGFSGGPVVFRPKEGRDDFRVAGVVAGYPRRFRPVIDEQGKEIARTEENPGLVVAYGITHATALIDRNPIGFVLPGA